MLKRYKTFQSKPNTIDGLKKVLQTISDDLPQKNSINKAILSFIKRRRACVKAGDTLNASSNKLFLNGLELLASCDSPKCQISMFSFDFNTSTMVKIVIFIVIVLHSSVVVQLRCSRYIVHRWIQRSVRIKQLQEFLKSDHWLQRYCILSGEVFYFEPPCISENDFMYTALITKKLHLAVTQDWLQAYCTRFTKKNQCLQTIQI